MKKQKVVTLAPEADHKSVYMFYNKDYDINLFVNAYGANEAQDIFNACCFEERWKWEIYLELENQPKG